MNNEIAEVPVLTMAGVPEHEISVLRTLTGYDEMLEIDRITKQYGVSEAELRRQMNGDNDMSAFVPEPKETPKKVNGPKIANCPKMYNNKKNVTKTHIKIKKKKNKKY